MEQKDPRITKQHQTLKARFERRIILAFSVVTRIKHHLSALLDKNL